MSSSNGDDPEERSLEDSESESVSDEVESASDSISDNDSESEDEDDSSSTPSIEAAAIDSLMDVLRELKANGGYIDYGLPWSPDSYVLSVSEFFIF